MEILTAWRCERADINAQNIESIKLRILQEILAILNMIIH